MKPSREPPSRRCNERPTNRNQTASDFASARELEEIERPHHLRSGQGQANHFGGTGTAIYRSASEFVAGKRARSSRIEFAKRTVGPGDECLKTRFFSAHCARTFK